MDKAAESIQNERSDQQQTAIAISKFPPGMDGAAAVPNVWLVSRPPENPAPTGWDTYSAAATATAQLLWPLLILCALLVFRTQLRAAVQALTQRIRDPNFSLAVGPFELTARVKELTSKVESLQVDSVVLSRQVSTPAAASGGDAAFEALRRLADEYRNVAIPDWQQRVLKKDELAAEMARQVISGGISRAKLSQERDEGMRMALATTIHFSPTPGDEELIKVAAPGVQLKHVRYRFMMAIGKLDQLGLISPRNIQWVLQLAEEYRRSADPPLLDRIDRTVSAVSAVTNRGRAGPQ